MINNGQDPITKTLGISWNCTENVFTVTASPVSLEFQTTKRNVLRKVATIFDPLGFVCPYVIVAKILLQELWMRGYDWDNEIQDEIANKIGNWFKQLKRLRKVKILRCLRSPEPVKSNRIVTFVDASQQAYGAAVYIRCQYRNDAVTSRLGVPKEVISDRGTNVVDAVGKLKKIISQLDRPQLQNKTVELGVTWRFNPPAAPHFGGAHEVMVKAAKKAIYAVVGITDEELITVFAGVESWLNSRLLIYQSSDPRDDVPLTPNHFLHGEMRRQFAPESVETTTFHLRQRWRKVQDIISRVWRRWLKECVPSLNSRPKWT